MDCLKNLITSRFLRNTEREINQANLLLQFAEMQEPYGFYFVKETDRKRLYNKYLNAYNFKESFNDIDIEVDEDMVYYLQENNVAWVACRYKHLVDQIITDSIYTTGDMCIHRAKHFIQNRLFHTAMFDLTFKITPITTN